jgi:spermidine/putrescine transport system substrate-binding protein
VSGQRHLSRRTFLRAVGTGGIALGTGLLGSCAGPGLARVAVGAGVRDLSGSEKVVRFANWFEYVDVDPKDPSRHPTLVEFTRRTKIAVDYSEPIVENDQFLGQIGIPMALGRSPGYDLVVLTDWMAAQFAGMGWAQPLSPDAIPNAARLLPGFRDKPLEDVRSHSLPWQGGFTGIAYDLAATGRAVTSMSDLLTAPDLRGRVGIVAEMRDVIGLVLLDMGVDPASFSSGQFSAALSRIDQAVRSGQIRTVTNNYIPDLTAGRIAACIAWPGDVIYVQPQYPHLRFTMPTAGGMLWTDNMLIPAYARHKRNAEALMNYYYEPDVAARLSAYELYISPVSGAEAAMRRIDPRLVGEPYIFPSPAELRRGHYFKLLPADQQQAYSSSFAAVVGS